MDLNQIAQQRIIDLENEIRRLTKPEEQERPDRRVLIGQMAIARLERDYPVDAVLP